MKKLILTALMALSSITMSAELYFRPLTEIESTELIKNKFIQTQGDHISIEMVFDNDKIDFNAYETVELPDGTIHLYGNSNKKTNIIYIKDDELIIPISQYRAIVVKDDILTERVRTKLVDL